MKNFSLGTTGNTVAGGIGGVILGQLLPMLSSGGLDSVLSGVVGQLAGGGVGGIVLTAIIGLIKNSMAAKA
ncbi:Membrane protein, putative [Brucella suis bv. 2]|nr:Membrane protein, putative [Brucella suis bv. 2]